jgi:CRP/FNR family transcriptional regulator, cyclic AMP receptor protein
MWPMERSAPTALAPRSTLSSLFDGARRRQLRAGEVLFHENDRSTRVFYCISGSLRLVLSGAHGRELILDVVLPGEVFGELAAIDHGGRTAAAIAVHDTCVAELDGEVYLAGVRRSADLTVAAMAALAHQLRAANRRICEGETERLSVRAARLLLDLTKRYASRADAPTSSIPITQTDLAEWLGASREATARVLSELRGLGAITTARSLITVIDTPRLASLATG